MQVTSSSSVSSASASSPSTTMKKRAAAARKRMERRRAIFGIMVVVLGIVAGTACNLDGKYDSSGGFGSSGFTSGTSGRGFFDAQTPSARSSVCDNAVLYGACGSISSSSSSSSSGTSSGQNVTRSDECELGDDPNPVCNTRLECQSQKWIPIDPPVACTHNCPDSLLLDRDGGCEGPDAKTLRCEYPDEAYTCGCAPFYTDGGVADGGTSGNPVGDSGTKVDGGKPPKPGRIPAGYKWTCVKPAAGCPRERPRLGAACVKPLSCDYGRCVFEDGEEDGLELRCYGRSWERQTGTYCP
jgi:hypothetical protein